MAEYLARDRLPGGMITFASAGTATVPGHPASGSTIRVMREVGIDVSAHRSTAIWDLGVDADFVYALSAEHYRDLIARWPDAADRIEMLAPDGRSIADPFGRSLTSYRRARDEIAAAIEHHRSRWVRLAEGSA